MRVESAIITQVESLFNAGGDPVALLTRLRALAVVHGDMPVLDALAQLHLVATARLRHVDLGARVAAHAGR